jgi:hypothetical protein
MFVGMTRARSRTHGLVIPPLSQPLLTAALCVFVSLALGVASTLQMICAFFRRDWHTIEAGKALPRETSGILNKEHSGPLGLRPAVTAQRQDHTRCASPTRHDAAHTESSRAEGGGGGSSHLRGEPEGAVSTPPLVVSFRAKAQRAADAEPRNDAHHRHDLLLLRSRSPRSRAAAGMTPLLSA